MPTTRCRNPTSLLSGLHSVTNRGLALRAGEAGRQIGRMSPTRASVVVVDDEPLVGSTLVRMFARLGYRAVLVLNPHAAQSALDQHRPTLLVSDLKMPGRWGIEVLSRAKETHPEVKRCLITGSFHEVAREEFPRIEPCVLLARPWSIEEFRTMLSGTEVQSALAW